MRVSSTVTLVAAIGSLVFCFLQTPITKFPTDLALSVIEEQYLREDMSAEDRKAFEFDAHWIRSNQRSAIGAYQSTMLALVLVTLVALAQVLTEKRIPKEKKAAEPGATDNPDDAQRM